MRSLPLGTPDDIAQGEPVLILAPHADDESLGCGGLIVALCRLDNPPYVLILTDGTGSHPGSAAFPLERLKAVREEEAREAVRRLGLAPDRIGFAGQRDTAAPNTGPEFDLVLEAVATLCRDRKIGAILAPWKHDPHCDHEAAHLLAVALARNLGLRHWSYPVWGWTLPGSAMLEGPMPAGIRLDIAGDLELKSRAIAAHASQYGGLITDDPGGFTLPRSLLEAFGQPFETFLRNPA